MSEVRKEGADRVYHGLEGILAGESEICDVEEMTGDSSIAATGSKIFPSGPRSKRWPIFC